MKKYLHVALVAVLAICISLAATGCFVRSLHSFHTADMAVDLPEADGSWSPVKEAANNQQQPWLFAGRNVTSFSREGLEAPLAVVYFKVGDQLFADFTAENFADGDGPSPWWRLHVVPAHSVCKLRLEGGRLVLTPLNHNWLKKALQEKRLALQHALIEDTVVLTGSTGELVDFLRQYGASREAFDPELDYEFVRQAPTGPQPLPLPLREPPAEQPR